MRKFTLTLLVLFGVAAIAGAQVPSPFSFYGGGLLSFPNEPTGFKDAYNNGFHGMAAVGYKAAPIAQLVGKVEYHHFGFDTDQLDGVSSGAQSVWMYGADLRIGLNIPASPIKPYVLGGLGMARVSFAQFEGTDLALTTAMNSSLPDPQSKLYYNFGGGLEFKLAPMASFFAQLRYVRISTDNEPTSYVPLTVGLKLF